LNFFFKKKKKIVGIINGKLQNTIKFKPKNIPLRDLELEKKYTVTRFEIIKTMYGPRVLVILDSKLRVILPDYFAKKITEKDTEKMNSNPVKFTLIYKGLETFSNGYKKHFVSFELNEGLFS
jgi:hypothetical protein